MRTVLLALFLAACGERSGLDAGTKIDAGRPDGGSIPPMVLARTVLDGDTLIIEAGASLTAPDGRPLRDTRIRLLGVDAPEIAHPPEPAECWGDESHSFAKAEVEGRIVELAYDFGHAIRDDFDRLLAYVSVGGKVLNEELIRSGNARAFRGFDHPEKNRYIQLEREARDANLGLWTCP